MKSLILAILGILVSATAVSAAAFELTSVSCANKYQFHDIQNNVNFYVKAESKGSFVEWEQEGLTYHYELTGIEADKYANPSSMQFARWELEKDAQGRIVHLRGTLNQLLANQKESGTLTQNYESATEYVSDEETIQKFIVDGKALEPVRATRKKLADGSIEVSSRNEVTEEDGGFRLLSTESKCLYKSSPEADLRKFFPKLARNAVEKFSAAVSLANMRDSVWANLIDATEFTRQVRKSAARDLANKIAVDKDVREGAGKYRVWDNPRLMDLLYRSSPYSRFRFCRLGC